MTSRVRAVNLTDFTGGLNLRGDAFALASNESPDMLNVDVDPRGGFVARKGWTEYTTQPSAGTQNMFVHERPDGSDVYYLAGLDGLGGGELHYSTNAALSWTQIQIGGIDLQCSAAPHRADFASWGGLVYIARGHDLSGIRMNADLTATSLGATFSEYVSPTNNVMPAAEVVASHLGYLFVGYTRESGVDHPTRIRWSHPNNPNAWQVDDFIDVAAEGGPITALVPNGDHLLIFKRGSVWALFGYDADSWQLVPVSREVGALHRNAIAVSESTVFFYAKSLGVYALGRDGQPPVEVSRAIRPMWEDAEYAYEAEGGISFGWVGQRLWCSFPWRGGTVLVLDPSLGGSWIAYRAADGTAPRAYLHGGSGGDVRLKLAASRSSNVVWRLEATDQAADYDIGSAAPSNMEPFESYYVTAWNHAGTPTLKKGWRRPDLVMKERDQGYSVTVFVYRDYDEATSVRERQVLVESGAAGGVWGNFVWGDGTLYGSPAKGSRVERGGSLGPARSVQLKVAGQPNRPWGVDAIVLKFVPRRMR